ncbi:MAG: hypothetical protein IT531_16220 [Burkholderiales bacterium]|nr:hypothetical protein [Burkholderiales bacterium]
MLKWIASKLKPDAALSARLRSPKTLQAFVEALCAQMPGEILASVSSVFYQASTLSLDPAELVRALDVLDAGAQHPHATLLGQLVDNSPRQVLAEPVWNALYEYHRARHAGYSTALALLAAKAPAGEHARDAAVMACRAMNALGRQVLLLRMRYQEPALDLTASMASLAAVSQTDARAVALVPLYPDGANATSVEREYLAALLLQVAPAANWLPAQQHALYLWLRRHAHHFQMMDRYDALARPFVLERGQHAKPERWLEGRALRPGMRFFGPGLSHAELRAEREQASGSRAVPDWIEPSQVSPALYRELLDALAAQWSSAPPSRRHRRDPGKGDILVAHDLAHIRRLVAFSEMARTGRSLDYDRFSAYALNSMLKARDAGELRSPTSLAEVAPAEALHNLVTYERALEQATETWKLLDMSDEGLGIEAAGAGAWLSIGMLIAYRQPESVAWALAMVRRLSRGRGETLRLGLHKLKGRAYAARLTVDTAKAGRGSSEAPLQYDAIRLASAVPCLIVPPGIFSPSWRYSVSAGKRWDCIQVQRCVDCGLDFERIEYALIETPRAA